ncbi:unnamed protein product [Rotaria socialis]|nr:unnamed protein product [Rotaria socialis]
MRKSRFDPSVPAVSQEEFYASNFLKHYEKTPRYPNFASVLESLQELNRGSDDYQELISELAIAPKEYDIIQVYSSNVFVGTKHFYSYINEQLFNDDDYMISKLMPLIRRATFQINAKGPSCPCVVYRGVNWNDDWKQQFEVGTVFRFPGFASTSLWKEKAQEFGDTLFAIHVDSDCLHARNISGISCYPAEKELLFSPYSLFQVVSQDEEAITLTSHDNMQNIGRETDVRTNNETPMMQISLSDEEDNMQGSVTTNAIATNYKPQVKGKASSNNKSHKKSCCIQ